MGISVLAAALGGFTAWMLGRMVSWLVRRNRLIAFLTAKLETDFRHAHASKKWVQRTVDVALVEGKPVSSSASFYADDLSSYSSIRQLFIELLFKKEMVLLIKAVNTLQEIECLMDGFCVSLMQFETSGKPLNQPAKRLLDTKAMRIVQLIDLLPRDVPNLASLPEDYAGKIGPEVMVEPAA
jgi:hypothetical protein